ncbi:MAG TPA: mandelate racemase/muconate lactonizing enzyme family protein [Pseudolysinimonas sp.]|jgi:L-alanine-DL-glutamate epimerase-like enolase superfamily enzyme
MSSSGRIRSLTVTPFAIPLGSPVRWATREVASREYVIVQVHSDSGATGVGYAYAGRDAARTLAAFIEDVIAPRMIHLPDDAPSRAWGDLYQETLLIGRRGWVLRAISAVDIAMWDLLGQLTGKPLSTLLGGTTDRVAAYASGGYYREGDPLENIDREIGRYLELGFTDVKIKVGGLSLDVDVKRVERVRELIGPLGRVALDANNAWKSPHDAIRFARRVEHCDPWWLEEPLAPDDIPGHAVIAAALDMPVATGEIHSTRWDFRHLIEAHAADILQPDVAVIGGVSEWIRVAHTASTFGLRVAPHWHQDIHVHLAAAVDNCLAVEWFDQVQDIVNIDRFLTTPLRAENGVLTVPDRSGIGLEIDWSAIERYRIDREGASR